MKNKPIYRNIFIAAFITFIAASILIFRTIWTTSLPGELTFSMTAGIAFLFFLCTIIFIAALKLLSVVPVRNETVPTIMPFSISAEESKEKLSVETDKCKDWECMTQIIDQLNGSDEPAVYADKILSAIARQFEVCQALMFLKDKKSDRFEILSKYAYTNDNDPEGFLPGEGLSGQVAVNRKILNIDELPDNYLKIVSGLGVAYPKCLIIAPLISDNETIGIVELASFKVFGKKETEMFEKFFETISLDPFLKKPVKKKSDDPDAFKGTLKKKEATV